MALPLINLRKFLSQNHRCTTHSESLAIRVVNELYLKVQKKILDLSLTNELFCHFVVRMPAMRLGNDIPFRFNEAATGVIGLWFSRSIAQSKIIENPGTI
jgi:hypothetical protein